MATNDSFLKMNVVSKMSGGGWFGVVVHCGLRETYLLNEDSSVVKKSCAYDCTAAIGTGNYNLDHHLSLLLSRESSKMGKSSLCQMDT